MAVKVAVASGKGGTGKTTVAINLFRYLNKENFEVHLVDCDVEEPNDLIFFPNAALQSEETIRQMIPEINTDKCTFCGKCVEYCEFSAISLLPKVKYAAIDKGLCHSCGACLLACMNNALTEKPHGIGAVSSYKVNQNKLTEGRLNVGSSMQTMLIKELKKRIDQGVEIVIYDAPPGTSCQVVETLSDADYVIVVTEPTPFGLNDMKLVLELIGELNKPFGVIINKAGMGNNDVKAYLQKHKIALMGEVPFNLDYATQYADGNLCDGVPENINRSYKNIGNAMVQNLLIHEGNNYFKW